MNDAATNANPLFDLSSLNLTDLTETFFADQQAANSDGEKFVVFFLDETLFAIPARSVSEVIRPLAPTPLPNAPAWLRGIANLRGEIVSIVDLYEFCRKRAAPVSPKSKFVVLRPRHYQAAVAFPIDRLSEIITLARNEIEPVNWSFVNGKAAYQSKPVYLLDTDRIFSSLLIG